MQPQTRIPQQQAGRRGFLERVIRRGYVQTVHQQIASDAMLRLKGADAAKWRRLFDCETKWLALGALVPDTEFRDFKNHTVLPRENYWGGAIPRAQSWYQNLVTALGKREWSHAAYSAGVLAHYVVDALHPFHTTQSEAENDVHFACDMAVEVAYTTLRSRAMTLPPAVVTALEPGPEFLARALAAGAEAANTHVEQLLNHCSLARAAVDPASALDPFGRDLMAAVLDEQTRLLAAIFDRAITDAAVAPPDVSLLAPAAHAARHWPLARLKSARRVTLARKRLAEMADELRLSGRVEQALADEERTKRDLFGREVLGQRTPVLVDNVFPFEPRKVAKTVRQLPADVPAAPASTPVAPTDTDDDGAEIIVLARHRATVDPARPAPRFVKAEAPRRRADLEASPVVAETVAPAAPAGIGQAAAAMLLPSASAGFSNFRDRRQTAADPQASDVDLPGLRPLEVRTLRAAGISTLKAFLEADTAELSARGGPFVVNAETLGRWQSRARLMQSVPALTIAEAELLVGSGYSDAASIATAEAEKVCADILAFVTTADGKRLLSAAVPPDVAKIRAVIDAARAAQAA